MRCDAGQVYEVTAHDPNAALQPSGPGQAWGVGTGVGTAGGGHFNGHGPSSLEQPMLNDKGERIFALKPPTLPNVADDAYFDATQSMDDERFLVNALENAPVHAPIRGRMLLGN
jgi:hypothetical protein